MAGSRVVFNKLPGIARAIPARADRVVRETLFEIEGRIKAEMAAPKSGADYDGHRASAPGEAPAIDTGAYVADVRAQPTGTAKGIVGTNQEQSEILEYGGERVEARPVWRDVAKDVEPEFVRKLKDLGI